MRLRKAYYEDFKNFIGMYKDMKLHCLYSPVELQPDIKLAEELSEEEKRHLIEMEILSEQFLSFYKEYGFKDFEADLERYEILIFCRDDGKSKGVDGYFMLAQFEPGIWRIVEWGCQPITKSNRLAMLQLLFKNARVVKIKKIELISYCSKEFYRSQGFTEINNGFFQKKCEA
ncbi:MAG: hypothetical protein IKF52_00955 [Clostridia bacterium]|nr:hypothetical protein [Clostridia bacterium]